VLSADRRFFATLRAREFPALDRHRLAYLDYTGAALPSQTQLRRHQELAQGQVLGNPHAEHAPSRASTEAIEAARAATLRFLDADPDVYGVCFTANASAAAKLVAEGFRFRRGELALSADNHNSVNGLREYARRAGARLRILPLTAELRLDEPHAALAALAARGAGNRLLAFPAQSNFSGVRHPLSLVTEAQRRGYAVLLDAAALVPTARLSLRDTTPEFVTLSFYKMFGFPTGVGALVARHDALRRLSRPWFAGGTVDWVSVQHRRHRLRSGIEGFEDGTPNFYGIAALDPGFAFLARVGMARLGRRVADLTGQLLVGLQRARHRDGAPLFRLYGPVDLRERGGTITFNVLDGRGQVIPFDVVAARARLAGVAVRGGCFCNPGSSEAAFRLPGAASLRCLKSTTDFTPRRFARCLGDGTAVGAIRASIGAATSEEDLRRGLATFTRIAQQRPCGLLR
jgi:selenocysteine lyase/cysteine desulfurase